MDKKPSVHKDAHDKQQHKTTKPYERIVLPVLVGLAIAGLSFWGGWVTSRAVDGGDNDGRFGAMMGGTFNTQNLPDRDDISKGRSGFGMRGAQTVATQIDDTSIRVKNIQTGVETTYTIDDDTAISFSVSGDDAKTSDITIGDSVSVTVGSDNHADAIVINTSAE